jgi:hypothetical protein
MGRGRSVFEKMRAKGFRDPGEMVRDPGHARIMGVREDTCR